MATERFRFLVRRCDPVAGGEPYWQEYALDVPEGMTVLEALLQIQAEQDGSLAFRYACRGAVCGSCAMLVNGREELACRTQVQALPGTARTVYAGAKRESRQLPASMERVVILEPLRNLPVLKDLIVDMEPFFEKFAAVEPWLQPAGPDPARERLVAPAQWMEAEPYTNCILCSCCYSACPAAEKDAGYLGPAALGQHYRFYADARDGVGERRLARMDSPQGVWGCDMVWNCVEICPKGVPPTQGIGKTRAAIRRAQRASKGG